MRNEALEYLMISKPCRGDAVAGAFLLRRGDIPRRICRLMKRSIKASLATPA